MFFTFAFLVAFAFATPNRSFFYLKDIRDTVDRNQFLPYSAAQKLQVANSIHNQFQVYAHKDRKVEMYDAEFKAYKAGGGENSSHTIDPIVRSAQLVEKAASLSDAEFHTAYSELYLSLKDLHTNYYVPGPRACFSFVQPFDFTVVEVDATFWAETVYSTNYSSYSLSSPSSSKYGSTENFIAVKSFAQQDEIVKLGKEFMQDVQPGDIVLQVDGMSLEQYIEDVKWKTGGSGAAGELRQALWYMSSRSGQTFASPPSDSSTFLIQSLQNPAKSYTITVPWIARRYDDAFQVTMKALDNIVNNSTSSPTFKKNLGSSTPSVSVSPGKKNRKIFISDLSLNLRRKEAFKTTLQDTVWPQFQQTSDPIVSWTIYKDTMAVIAITNFSLNYNGGIDKNTQVDSTTRVIRNLLVGELKNTDFLMFDVRGNPGGSLEIADRISQLFPRGLGSQPFANVTMGKVLHRPINTEIFKSIDKTDFFYQAYQRGQMESPNDQWAPVAPFNKISLANQYGVAYLKPVALFHNGNCYSACDAFSALLKDNANATIFSEDLSSGGGGASVADYNSFFTSFGSLYFPPFPFTSFFGRGGDVARGSAGARLAWRQIIRNLNEDVVFGKNDLIEDEGVVADFPFVRPKPEELITLENQQTNSQYDFIYKHMKMISGQKKRQLFLVRPQIMADVSIGANVTFDVEHLGISSFQVYQNNTAVTKVYWTNQRKRSSKTYRTTRISFPPVSPRSNGTFDIQVYEIKVFASDSAYTFSTFKKVRLIPSDSFIPVLKVDAPVFADFSVASVYNSPDNLKGWNIVQIRNLTAIQIGNGSRYDNNLDSTLVYFADVSNVLDGIRKRLQVSFDLDLDSERIFDFFSLSYQVSGRDSSDAPFSLMRNSGAVNGTQTFMITVPPPRIEEEGEEDLLLKMEFRFMSDGATNARGVSISKLIIQAG